MLEFFVFPDQVLDVVIFSLILDGHPVVIFVQACELRLVEVDLLFEL